MKWKESSTNSGVCPVHGKQQGDLASQSDKEEWRCNQRRQHPGQADDRKRADAEVLARPLPLETDEESDTWGQQSLGWYLERRE